MHGLTQFEKWVGCQLEKAGPTCLIEKYHWLGREGKFPGFVIWGSALERGAAQRKGPWFTFTLALSPCWIPVIYCILALDVKMWKLLKRLFWLVRCYLLSRLLPTKYFKSQEVLNHSPRDSDITILKFRVCLPQCSVSVDILTIQGMSRGRSDFKEFYKYCVCFDLPIP